MLSPCAETTTGHSQERSVTLVIGTSLSARFVSRGPNHHLIEPLPV